MRYSVTGNGLHSVEQCKIRPGHIYYMGASSSPSLILITRIDGETVFYMDLHAAEWGHTYGEGEGDKENRMESWIMQSLIVGAEHTIATQYAQTVSRMVHDPLYEIQKRATKARTAFIGGKGYEYDPRVICNYCGDDTEAVDGRSICCESDCRASRNATQFVKGA